MTDTHFFYTIAINRKTGEWKKFFSLFPQTHHNAALKWLSNNDERR